MTDLYTDLFSRYEKLPDCEHRQLPEKRFLMMSNSRGFRIESLWEDGHGAKFWCEIPTVLEECTRKDE